MIMQASSNSPVIQVKETANEYSSHQDETKNPQRRLKRVQALEFLPEIQVGHCV